VESHFPAAPSMRATLAQGFHFVFEWQTFIQTLTMHVLDKTGRLARGSDCVPSKTLPVQISVPLESLMNAGHFGLRRLHARSNQLFFRRRVYFLSHCSRKWMSGQADALTATKDRGRFAEKTRPTTTLRETPSAGRTPSLLDFYLSWMSPGFPDSFVV